MTTPDRTAERLAEDVADLTATVTGLAAQLEATQRLAESLQHDSPAAAPAVDDDEQQQPAAPPLILKLSGEEYDQELAALAVWVEHLLVPVYLTEVSTTAPWCAQWWQHPQAVARLHALWLAWQELTTPEAGGYTGPSVWARDHLDPTMAQLRAPNGPFGACTTIPHRPQHTLPPQPAVSPLPET